MSSEFAEAVANWHDFHEAVAGVSATLVGLLFVGLALNPAIMRDDSPYGMRTWAGLTFHNFLVVLAISLVVLIPDLTPAGLAVPLAVLGAQGLYRVARDIQKVRQDPDPRWHGRRIFNLFISPGIAYLLCVWAAVEIWQKDPDGMYQLLWTIFLLVMGATSSCWDLLREIGSRESSATAEPPGQG